MASIKRGAGNLARWLFLPVVRPMEQAAASARQVKADLAHAREVARERLERERELEARPQGGVVSHPREIHDPSRRFEAYYVANEWTEDALHLQICGYRLTKRCCVAVGLLMLAMAIAGVFVLKAWLQVLMAPVILTVGCLTCAQALRFGLLQSHLETRRLHSLHEYFARPDFFSHVLWR